MELIVSSVDPPADSADHRKARGAFFTPPALANFLSAWAIRSGKDRVLEPSSGEAAFLVPAGLRLRELGSSTLAAQLVGVDIHPQSVINAGELTAAAGIPSTIVESDFFDFKSDSLFDAIVGNPPYVRYQDFTGSARAKGQQAAFAQGVRLTGLASSWAPFVVHAAQFLTAEGRLGLVLPAELLSVNYAAAIRSFLLRRFKSVRLVLFEERVFPNVLEEVVLLLAEGQGPTDQFSVHQVQNLDHLQGIDWLAAGWQPAQTADKWSLALIRAAAAEIYQRCTTAEGFEPLSKWGDVTLGAVTGNNGYFTLTRKQVADLGLWKRDLLPISPPGSHHLRGLTFTTSAWEELEGRDQRVWMFYPAKEPSAAGHKYITTGESKEVHLAYKCTVREPWWRVPLVDPADLFFTYMNYDSIRLVRNAAGVMHLNSVHGMKFAQGRKTLGQDLLPMAALNSLTLLGAEVVGRAYGGGILKMEPREAASLPVPSFSLIEKVADDLRALRPQLAKALRGGKLSQVATLVDRVLLVEGLGMRAEDVKLISEAREAMFARRSART